MSSQVKPLKMKCKHSLFNSQEGKDDYRAITRTQRRGKPHRLGGRRRDYRVAAALMMMTGKEKNNHRFPSGCIKLHELAEMCGI